MNRRIVFGIGLLVLVAVLIALVPPESHTVFGYTGGSKDGLLQDPEVTRILAERYHLRVEYKKLGSLGQCTVPAADLAKTDWIWPGNELSLVRCNEALGHQLPFVTVFHSPIVFYSWDVVTDALVQQGLVQQHDGVYYVDDMLHFTRVLWNPPAWKDLGLAQLNGRFEVRTTDPTKSNSGDVYFAILATMRLGNTLPTEATIVPVLPELKDYLDKLGYVEPSTEELFKRCVGTGVGKCPIFVAYESQLIEYLLQNEHERPETLKHIRFIYPRPTELGRHTLIALTPNGEALQRAMLDKDIQTLAATRHGFRIGPNAPADIPGLAPAVESVIQMPAPKVMDLMTTYLQSGQ